MTKNTTRIFCAACGTEIEIFEVYWNNHTLIYSVEPHECTQNVIISNDETCWVILPEEIEDNE